MARTSSGGQPAKAARSASVVYGIAALRVRVVGAPHDAVDAEVVAQRRLARAQEAGADPEVAVEVLAIGVIDSDAATAPKNRASAASGSVMRR